MRNLPYGFDNYLNVKTIRKIEQIFVAFSEKLMIMKGVLAPLYLLQNFSEKTREKKKNCDNPQLFDPYSLLSQCFFPETINPNYRTEDQRVFLA